MDTSGKEFKFIYRKIVPASTIYIHYIGHLCLHHPVLSDKIVRVNYLWWATRVDVSHNCASFAIPRLFDSSWCRAAQWHKSRR